MLRNWCTCRILSGRTTDVVCCGKTLIGSSTLAAFQDMLKQRNLPSGDVYSAENKFRFGNGAVETATRSVWLPVGLNGKYGLIEADIISGSAPLLLGRPTSEKLNVHLDFQNNKIKFLDMGSQDMHANVRSWPDRYRSYAVPS